MKSVLSKQNERENFVTKFPKRSDAAVVDHVAVVDEVADLADICCCCCFVLNLILLLLFS